MYACVYVCMMYVGGDEDRWREMEIEREREKATETDRGHR